MTLRLSTHRGVSDRNQTTFLCYVKSNEKLDITKTFCLSFLFHSRKLHIKGKIWRWKALNT